MNLPESTIEAFNNIRLHVHRIIWSLSEWPPNIWALARIFSQIWHSFLN